MSPRFPTHRKTRAQKIEECGSTRELDGFIDRIEADAETMTLDERAAEARCRALLARKGAVMAKRSGQYKRKARDFYASPAKAVWPLKAHLSRGVKFAELFAGDGAIIAALAGYAECVVATDIDPQAEGIYRLDVSAILPGEIAATGAECIITNSPWPRPGGNGEPVIGYIEQLSDAVPTWMLLPFDFAANAYFQKVVGRCVKIVPIGRVSWEGNGVAGKDNAAWFLFDGKHIGGARIFARPRVDEYA